MTGVRGVLAYQELKDGVAAGWIGAGVPIEERQFQPASLDLRLGPIAYQLRASFLPLRETVERRLTQPDALDVDLVIDQLSLEKGATFQRGSVYLVPLM